MRTQPAFWLACVVFAACSGGKDSPPAPGAIRISNQSTHAFDRVYAGPSPVTVFQNPANDAPIAPGASFTFDGLAPGNWDVLASLTLSQVHFSAISHDVPLTAGETVVLSVADSDFSGRFTVTNSGPSDVTAVHVAGLPDNVLEAPVASGLTVLPPYGFRPGTYSVRCDYLAGTPYTADVLSESLVVTAFTCQTVP
jgi:hypothetical protein